MRRAGTISGADTANIADNEAAIGEGIKQLADKGFIAQASDTASQRVLGFGVEAYRGLQTAAKDGLTVKEIATATQMSDADVTELIGTGLGTVSANGKVTAQDQQKLIQQLATFATKNLSTAKNQEQFLNAGMSETERQSLSVYKTAEMVDALWSKLKTEGVIKVADPAGNTSGDSASESRPPAGAKVGRVY